MSRCPLLTTGRAVGINLHGVSSGGVSRPPEHHLSWARGQCQGWVNVIQAVTAVIQAVTAAVVWAVLQSIIHHETLETEQHAPRGSVRDGSMSGRETETGTNSQIALVYYPNVFRWYPLAHQKKIQSSHLYFHYNLFLHEFDVLKQIGDPFRGKKFILMPIFTMHRNSYTLKYAWQPAYKPSLMLDQLFS